MPSLLDDAGRGPVAVDGSDESTLFGRVERDPDVTSEKELADAFAGIASLLLDAARKGQLPTLGRASTCPDASRRGGQTPPRIGDAA